MPSPSEVRARLDAVISAMQSAGIWDTPPPPAHDGPIGAFGTNAMSFETWLRHVFVSRVESLIASNGPWPAGSQVSVQATREWQMWGSWDKAEPIIDALRRFDGLFDGAS